MECQNAVVNFRDKVWLPLQLGSKIDAGEENIVSPPSCSMSFLVFSELDN